MPGVVESSGGFAATSELKAPVLPDLTGLTAVVEEADAGNSAGLFAFLYPRTGRRYATINGELDSGDVGGLIGSQEQ